MKDGKELLQGEYDWKISSTGLPVYKWSVLVFIIHKSQEVSKKVPENWKSY